MSRRSPRFRPLAVVLAISLAIVGLALTPDVAQAAKAPTSSSIAAKVVSDINAWRAKKHVKAFKRNSRIDKSLTAEIKYEIAGDISTANPSDLGGAPSGADSSKTYLNDAQILGGTVISIAKKAAAKLESLDSGGFLASDNYAGLAVVKYHHKRLVHFGAYQYDSQFKPRTKAPKVTLSGTNKVGHTITAHSSIASSSTSTIGFIWWIGGQQQQEDNSNAGVYTLQPGDKGKRVVVWAFNSAQGKDQNAGAAVAKHVVAG